MKTKTKYLKTKQQQDKRTLKFDSGSYRKAPIMTDSKGAWI